MNLPTKIIVRGLTKPIRQKLNEVIDYLGTVTPRSSATVRANRTSSGAYFETLGKKKSTTGAALEAFELVSVEADYLVCKKLGTETTVNVSKPFELRPDNWDSDNNDGLTYERISEDDDALTRQAKKTFVGEGELTASEQVFPHYSAGSLIWATSRTFTEEGFTIEDSDGKAIAWHDINTVGRSFRMPRQLVKVCLENSPRSQMFPAGDVI